MQITLKGLLLIVQLLFIAVRGLSDWGGLLLSIGGLWLSAG
jgi:hypothetical protein